MIKLYAGKTHTIPYPKKASTAFEPNTLVAFDGSGNVRPATSADGAGDIVGVCHSTITSADSDYAQNTSIPIEVPTEENVEWRITAAGTAVAGDVGLFIDLTDAATANRAASLEDALQVTRFVSATELIVKFN